MMRAVLVFLTMAALGGCSTAFKEIGVPPAMSPVGSGLPLVPISDLDAVAAGTTTVLTAATYGLGFYRTTTS